MIVAQKVSTKFFTWSPKSKTFVTEVSDLPKSFNPFGRIYDDACDAGFTLVSHVTGKEITFVHWKNDVCDGEVAGWKFKPVLGKRDMALAGITVLIIND
jgi:hypothetical protein